MLSGDGFVVRVRPHGGRLSRAQAAGIAALAAQHGNGMLDLTSRANLQIRGVQPSTLPALLDGLRALSLLDDSPEIEARRNILVSPFAHDGDGTQAMAAELAQALARPDAPALPEKFGFAVDSGPHPVLRDSSADIRIERVPGGVLVSADGFATAALVETSEAVHTAIELARWYLAATANQHPRSRMAHLAACATLPPHFQTAALQATDAATPQVGATPQGWLVGIELGQLSAKTLEALSDLGDLRITPWRLLLIEGAHQMPEVSGLITCADDPSLRVVACTGAPGCLQAHTETRKLARAMAPLAPVGHLLHISGCAKGCAHHKDTLTLVGTPSGINLVRHGKASSAPDAHVQTPEAIAAYLTQLFQNPTPHAPPL
jgi:precorrin-3B synthase